MARLVLSLALVALVALMAQAQNCPVPYAPVLLDGAASGNNAGFTPYDLSADPRPFVPLGFNFPFFNTSDVSQVLFDGDVSVLFFPPLTDAYGALTVWDTDSDAVPLNQTILYDNSNSSKFVFTASNNYASGMSYELYTTIWPDGFFRIDYVNIRNVSILDIFPDNITNSPKVNALTFGPVCEYSNLNNGSNTFPSNFKTRFVSGLAVLWCNPKVLYIPTYGAISTNESFSVPIVLTRNSSSHGCETYLRATSVFGGSLTANGVNVTSSGLPFAFNSSLVYYPNDGFSGTGFVTFVVTADVDGTVATAPFNVTINVISANKSLLPPLVDFNNGNTTNINTPLTGIQVSSANNGTEAAIYIYRISVIGGSLRLAANNATINNNGQFLNLTDLAGGLIFVPDFNFVGTVTFGLKTSSNGLLSGLSTLERTISFVVQNPTPTPTPGGGSTTPAATFNFVFSNMFVI